MFGCKMLLKTSFIFLTIYKLSSICVATHVSVYNETNLVLSIKSQQTELKGEQKRQEEIITDFVKKSDNQDLHAKLDRLESLIDGLVKTEIQILRVEQERQGKLIDTLYRNSLPVSELLPNLSRQPFKVVSDAETQGGGWTIILRRMDGSVNFYRNWTEYRNGFGDLNGEFFLGLDKIHALTTERIHSLLVILEDFDGTEKFETYEEFAIGGEEQQYILHTLGKANGTAGDSLSYHHQMKFSTLDRDNDIGDGNCAVMFPGAWWYKSCSQSQLTGSYNETTYKKGVNWSTFRGYSYSLKKAIMMIRPR